MERKTKKRKLGRIIYAICILLYMIALSGVAYYGLKKVWTYAEEYERSRPTKVMDEYIANLDSNFWNDSMQATIAAMPHEMQTDDECAAVVQDMIKDGVSYVRTVGGNDSEVVYSIRCATGVFGKVTTTEDKSVDSEFNLYPWKIVKEEFDFNGLYSSIQATIPASYQLQINGHTLGEEYIIESGIHYDMLDEYYASYSGLPTKVTYRFDNIIGIVEPVILDNNGEVYVVDTTRDDSQYIVPCNEDETYVLDEFCHSFVYTYFRFSSGLAPYGDVVNYVIKGGDLDQHFKAAEDGLSWAHTGAMSMDEYSFDGAIKLDDNVYFCDVTAVITAVGVRTDVTENHLRLVITYFPDGGYYKVTGLEYRN